MPALPHLRLGVNIDHVATVRNARGGRHPDPVRAAQIAIEAGADDVISSSGGHEIYASQDGFRDVAKALEAKFGEPRKASLLWKPQNTVALDDESGEKVLKLIESLDDSDDVQNVYANFEVSDALVAKMSA